MKRNGFNISLAQDILGNAPSSLPMSSSRENNTTETRFVHSSPLDTVNKSKSISLIPPKRASSPSFPTDPANLSPQSKQVASTPTPSKSPFTKIVLLEVLSSNYLFSSSIFPRSGLHLSRKSWRDETIVSRNSTGNCGLVPILCLKI